MEGTVAHTLLALVARPRACTFYAFLTHTSSITTGSGHASSDQGSCTPSSPRIRCSRPTREPAAGRPGSPWWKGFHGGFGPSLGRSGGDTREPNRGRRIERRDRSLRCWFHAAHTARRSHRYPRFNDAHAHPGAPLPGVGFRTSDDPVPDPPLLLVLDSLSALVPRVPAGTWLRTSMDATTLDDPRARRGALDSVAPRHPVWLGADTGHGMIVNSAGLRVLGIPDDPADPVGGFYEREGAPYPGRGRGRITGLLHEYAGSNASQRLRSSQPDSILVADMRRYGERALRLGITSVQNMTMQYDAATTLRVQRLAELPIRVRIIPMPATSSTGRLTSEWRAAIAEESRRPGGLGPKISVSGTKWILDVTGIERLALLETPYQDRPGWRGTSNFSRDTLRAMLRESLVAGEQPVLHAR